MLQGDPDSCLQYSRSPCKLFRPSLQLKYPNANPPLRQRHNSSSKQPIQRNKQWLSDQRHQRKNNTKAKVWLVGCLRKTGRSSNLEVDKVPFKICGRQQPSCQLCGGKEAHAGILIRGRCQNQKRFPLKTNLVGPFLSPRDPTHFRQAKVLDFKQFIQHQQKLHMLQPNNEHRNFTSSSRVVLSKMQISQRTGIPKRIAAVYLKNQQTCSRLRKGHPFVELSLKRNPPNEGGKQRHRSKKRIKNQKSKCMA